MSESKNTNDSEVSELKIATHSIQPAAIITYTDFKVISTEKKGRVTTALTVKLSAVSPGLSLGSGKNSLVVPDDENENEDDLMPSPLVSPCALHRNVIKLDLTNKRHPKYIHPVVSISANGRVSPGLLADPGEELLIQKIIENHKKYSRDYLMGLRESKRALQLPVGLPNIPDLLPTSKQVVIVQTNSNAGPHKANHHKQGHHHHSNNAGGHHNSGNNQTGNHHANNQGTVHHQGGHVNTGYQSNNNTNNSNTNTGGYHNNRRNTVGSIPNNNQHQVNNNYQNNGNYSKYYNNQHHNNHFNTQNYGTKKHVNNINQGYKPVQEQ